MYSLSDTEFTAKVEPTLKKVFCSFNPFGKPFSSNITNRKIIYPLYNYPEKLFLEILIQAGANEGDTGCYLKVFWESKGHPSNCYIPFSELIEGFASPSMGKGIEERLNMCIFSDYVLFSERGKWGLIVSDTHHGLLGGSCPFIQLFEEILPDFDNQVYDFLEVMQDLKSDGSYQKLDWFSPMLVHVYGEDEANKMLEKMEQRLR